MTINRSLSDFDLSKLESNAKHKATCQKCFGSGQLHYSKPIESWEICPECKGEGKAALEPHVIKLVAEIRSIINQVEAIDQHAE